MQGDQAVRAQDLFWCLCDPAVIENGGTYDSRTRKQLKRADSLSTRKRKITFFIARKISFGVLIPTK